MLRAIYFCLFALFSISVSASDTPVTDRIELTFEKFNRVYSPQLIESCKQSALVTAKVKHDTVEEQEQAYMFALKSCLETTSIRVIK